MAIKSIFTQPIPLTLYIHIPWCVRKCPYCDFNSHRAGQTISEEKYISQLITDLEQSLPKVWGRRPHSIFIGGGTPSLFSAKGIETLLQSVHALLPFSPQCEITLEANPGTIEQQKFSDFYHAGINRLSLGIQSFQDDKLQTLGRIHNAEQAKRAIDIAQQSGIKRVNIDIMHGLPQQNVNDALYDLQTAIDFTPEHISWYQLTIETGTVFAKHRPTLPDEKHLGDIEQQGKQLLAQHGYQHYEVSAYCQPQGFCRHNLNYWQFGDYLGIGAGAHSKITNISKQVIERFWKLRNPRDYLATDTIFTAGKQIISSDNLALEFMMNALRLTEGVPLELFCQRTGLNLTHIEDVLREGQRKKLLTINHNHLKTTKLGQQFLNDCLLLFDKSK